MAASDAKDLAAAESAPSPAMDVRDLESRELTLPQAITTTLAHSEEIHVVSYDPAIAEQEITRSAGEFDTTLFGGYNYEETDRETSSVSEVSRSTTYEFETGFRQKGILGSEWSLGYTMTRTWDDLFTRNPQRRFEPVLAFQLKQPLLRDAWKQVNLAGVDIARLAHRIALQSFLQKAEDITTEAIAAYWQLVQARRDLDIQENLLNMANVTLDKVKGRQGIDATDAHIQQTAISQSARRAALLQAQKRVRDAQDILLRLMADPDMTLLQGVELIPVSPPNKELETMDVARIVQQALKHNPIVNQARLQIDITNINVRVAENQQKWRLDLIASASNQHLDQQFGNAHSSFRHFTHTGGGVGLTMEIPLGNRIRQSDLQRRKLERRQSQIVLRNIKDQILIQANERIRRVETSFAEIQVQASAIEAATGHLQALEDQEDLRQKLTPEFLLVKLQAQDSLAQAQRAHARTLTDYNVALAQLAQTTGRVLSLHEMKLPEAAK